MFTKSCLKPAIQIHYVNHGCVCACSQNKPVITNSNTMSCCPVAYLERVRWLAGRSPQKLKFFC